MTLKRRASSTATDSLVHDGQVLASGATFSELMALPPQHLRYESKLGQFRREASFEKSVFIMTKFPEGESQRAGELSAVIKTVQRAISAAGFVPRIASERMYFDDVWSNVELYLLGCRYGVAIVEGRFKPELNPNVAMEWGWMRGLGKDVLFLVEKQANKFVRADWSGLIRQEFSWNEPRQTIPHQCADGWSLAGNLLFTLSHIPSGPRRPTSSAFERSGDNRGAGQLWDGATGPC